MTGDLNVEGSRFGRRALTSTTGFLTAAGVDFARLEADVLRDQLHRPASAHHGGGALASRTWRMLEGWWMSFLPSVTETESESSEIGGAIARRQTVAQGLMQSKSESVER